MTSLPVVRCLDTLLDESLHTLLVHDLILDKSCRLFTLIPLAPAQEEVTHSFQP